MTIPEGYSRVTMLFDGAGIPNGAASVWAVANPTDLSPTAVGTAFVAAVSSSTLDGRWSNDVRLAQVLVKNGPDETGPSAFVAANLTGGQVDNSAPSNVAWLVHKATNFGGRRGRGRAYFPGVPEQAIDDAGNILAATVTGWNSILDAFADACVVSDIQLVLEHQPATVWVLVDGQPRRQPIGTAPAPSSINDGGLTLDPKVATQRRRLRR